VASVDVGHGQSRGVARDADVGLRCFGPPALDNLGVGGGVKVAMTTERPLAIWFTGKDVEVFLRQGQGAFQHQICWLSSRLGLLLTFNFLREI
jgi:hypothetical protein